MLLSPDLSGFGIQIVPIYRDPDLSGLSSIFVDFVGEIGYTFLGFRGGIAHRRKAMSSTAHAMGYENRGLAAVSTDTAWLNLRKPIP